MKISIFTPTHDSSFLLDTYNSIKNQPFDEWIILYNNNAKQINIKDSRIKHIKTSLQFNNVGIYKRMACDRCSGDIIIELDHDDLLMPYAIIRVHDAFKDHKVGFVYSDALRINMSNEPAPLFNPDHGWKNGEVTYKDNKITYPISFEPTPASVSRIWYAPDHVRAYRKSVYKKVGGHNPNLPVLDDQDLICRMYLESKFYRIEDPLYVYRIHGENTWLKYNQIIQDSVYSIYDQYIESLTLKWADDKKIRKIDLGGRINSDNRYESVDLSEANINTDLNQEWPFDDGSVGVVRANDIFEHLKDPIHVMKELSRVLCSGGYAFIQVPSTDGRGAFQDPTHKSFWNENSFLYYTHEDWAKYIDTPVKFQAMRLYTTEKDQQGVCWTRAHLVNLKGGYRPPGIINF